MINRKIDKKIWSYLNDEDTLALRLTCTSICVAMRNNPGVCHTKSQFLIRVTGVYKDKYSFNEAWLYYHKIINTANNLPATLHKLRDPNVVKIQVEICKQFKSTEYLSGKDGRLYYPGNENGKHTWSLNYAWMMANIDIKRSFIILSHISDEYLTRQSFPAKVSAFAKEIGMAMDADYSLGFTINNLLVLTPPDIQEKGYFVISNHQTVTFFKVLQKNKEKLLLEDAIKQMQKTIEDNLIILNAPIRCLKDLTECFNEELLMDFADFCLVEVKAVLAKYPDLIDLACQMFLNSNIEKNETILIDYLRNDIYQKFHAIFKKRYEEFDSPHTDASSIDYTKDNDAVIESGPDNADVTQDVDGEVEDLTTDFGKAELDEMPVGDQSPKIQL